MTNKSLDSGAFNTEDVSIPIEGDAATTLIPVADPKDIWKDEKQPWAATMGGRLAIRAVSRGMMGAAFYAWGGHKTQKDMQGYDPENPQGTIQHIARFFDVAAGRPIEKVFGENAVKFRPTLTDREKERTLGEDVVDNTFNFAMATVGDALGRNIVGIFDPNAPSKWRNEEGKISFPKAVKSMALAGGRIFEAQMEDWFVAVPYAYQKRAQRKIINHFSPGFQYDADRALNGASFKVDEHGNVTGNYAIEGAIDLQGRFTGYNIGTMVFRDAMRSFKKKVGGAFDKENEDVKLNVPATPTSIAKTGTDGIRNGIRYLIKSNIKALMIMTPSVPFFWATRTAQSKDIAMAIGPDGKPLLDMQGDNIRLHRENAGTLFAQTTSGDVIQNPFANFDPYDQTYGVLDTMINPFGRASDRANQTAQKIATSFAAKHGLSEEHAADMTNRYIKGTMAYTPYIYAKSEFAHRWDNQEMDNAIYRTIDGMFGLNMKELKGGVRDIRESLKGKSPDLHRSHPETVPPNYDPKRKGFVQRVKDTVGRSQGDDWQTRINTEPASDPELPR